MSEADTNGAGGGGFDVSTTKRVLSSSSTSLRTQHLQTLAERLAREGAVHVYKPHLSKTDEYHRN